MNPQIQSRSSVDHQSGSVIARAGECCRGLGENWENPPGFSHRTLPAEQLKKHRGNSLWFVLIREGYVPFILRLLPGECGPMALIIHGGELKGFREKLVGVFKRASVA